MQRGKEAGGGDATQVHSGQDAGVREGRRPGQGVGRALLTRGRAAVLWPRLQAAKTKTPCCRARLGDGRAWRSRRGTLGPGLGSGSVANTSVPGGQLLSLPGASFHL